MDINIVLQSIISGLATQTVSGKIKWLSKSEVAKATPKYSFYEKSDEKKEVFDHQFYYVDGNTVIYIMFYLNRDYSIRQTWMSIEDENLRNGSITHHGGSQEYTDLIDAVYNKYVTPRIKRSSKSEETDIEFLTKLNSRFGKEAVRDLKLSELLDEPKGLMAKIFKRQ